MIKPQSLVLSRLFNFILVSSGMTQAMVQEQTGDHRWGPFAQLIANGTMWKQPASGGHDDKAHPPIHPTRYRHAFLVRCANSAVDTHAF